MAKVQERMERSNIKYQTNEDIKKCVQDQARWAKATDAGYNSGEQERPIDGNVTSRKSTRTMSTSPKRPLEGNQAGLGTLTRLPQHEKRWRNKVDKRRLDDHRIEQKTTTRGTCNQK